MSSDRSGLSPLQRRLRAAFDTSEQTAASKLPEYAAEIGVSVDTFQAIEEGTDARSRARTKRYVQAVSDATGVPVEWLHDGWPAVSPSAPPESDVEQLRDEVAELRRSFENFRRDGGQPG